MSEYELSLDDRDARMLAAVNFGRRIDNMIRIAYDTSGNAMAVARHFQLTLDDVLFIVQNADRPVKAGGPPVVITRANKPVR